MSETRHGVPAAGYRPQGDDKIAIVNVNKELEERCLRQIDAMMKPLDGTARVPHDIRMISIARTGLQEAFMWLNRAVFQPSRVALPGDVQEQIVDDNRQWPA